MRILFLESHPMWIYGLPNGFIDAGHQVKISGPLTADNIPPMIAGFGPELIVTIGWTTETNGDKTAWIKKHVKAAGIPHVYWATEDSPHGQSFSLNYIKQTEPDFIFTICPAAIENYHRQGIRAAYLDFGFHDQVHHPAVDGQYRTDIVVVANAYPKLPVSHYRWQSIQALIRPVLRAKMRIDFWGNRWEEMTDCIKGVPAGWRHGPLPYTEANKVYSSAKIILGFQNHPTQLTQRVYEILGSGGFLLTDDTPAVRRLFEPGRDLVVTASPHETVSLVLYYLINSGAREKIRRQGRASVAEHSYCNRAKYILNVLQAEGVINPVPG